MNINLKKHLTRNLLNIPGWRTKRKIVVIESDDWGSIRMPSKDAYLTLLKKGIRVNQCPYNSLDALESESDLTSLFEVLTSIRDKYGNNPVVTANSVVANPDFERIEKSGFHEYFYETFLETYKRYPNHSNSFKIIQEGIREKIFFPQYHGREHLNVSRWMGALLNQLPETRLAFDNQLFGIGLNITSETRKSILASMDYDSSADSVEKQLVLESGLELFKSIYGYQSKSYIATNHIWGNDILPILQKNQVKYIQGIHKQLHPNPPHDEYSLLLHFLGERNNYGQLYLIRNCFFEPALIPQSDSVDDCLKDIQASFFYHKPAIISMHRVNFMGGIIQKNKETNLKSLYSLLSIAVKKWPAIEFMTSSQLGDLMTLSR
jgi:hypothetical protein